MSQSKSPTTVAKRSFVKWFTNQPNATRYELATTGFHSRMQIARFRRLYLKALSKRHQP